MSLPSAFAFFVVTAGSFFALGAYYQHYDVLKKIQRLERYNPHAYFIRRKLYALLNFFSTGGGGAIANKDDTEDGGNAYELTYIMKYGFPSTNDIYMNKNYVSSYDRRNAAILWMCEHLHNDEATFSQNRTNMHNALQTEACRVFFMSNIKPFLSKGFNITIWTKLHMYIYELAERFGSVYTYTGSIYLPRENAERIWSLEYQPENALMVAVPTHFFKILIIDPKEADETPYAEAFVMPNATLSDKLDIHSLLCDIRDIENSTGLIFFEGLERNFVNTHMPSKD